MLWDLAVLGVIWPMRNRLRPYGMLFALYLALYAGGKFLISFLRVADGPTDIFMDKQWAWGMGEAHFISLTILAIMIPLLLFKAQVVRPEGPSGQSRSPSHGGV